MTWLQHLAYAVDFAVVLCLLVSAEVPGCQGDESRAADAPTKHISETGGWGFSYGPLPTREQGRLDLDKPALSTRTLS